MSEKTKEIEDKTILENQEDVKTEEPKIEEIKAEEQISEKEETSKTEETVAEEEKVEIQNASTLDFDWDSADTESDEYSKDKRDELKNLYSETLSVISEKEVLDGNIILKKVL